LSGSIEERVLILPFLITWRAKVTTDARFKNISLVNLDMRNNSFETITEELRKDWNLEKYT